LKLENHEQPNCSNVAQQLCVEAKCCQSFGFMCITCIWTILFCIVEQDSSLEHQNIR